MKIKITKYGHSGIFAIIGMWLCMYPWLWSSFAGGLMIGWGLRLAREYGEENGRY
jgi:hypothetical protein